MGRPITAEDLWSLHRVGQPEHVPGTTNVVVPVVAYREDGKAHSTIYSIDRKGTTVRLTSDDRSSESPAPSSDGTRIAFLGSIGDEPAQVYVMSLAGGEAFKVSDLPLGASSVTWVPNRDALIVSAPLLRGHSSVEDTREEQEARKDATRPIVTEDRVFRHWKKWLVDGRIDHLFRIDLDDESAHHLTPASTG
jgi:dipeptidyl aminopeptidase/acylaminoacyl peptidase